MAATTFLLSDLQSHAALMTRHDGLAENVKTWTNRVIQDICTRAYWMRNTGMGFALPFQITSGSVSDIRSAIVPLATPNASLNELINVVGVDHVILTGAGTSLQVGTFKNNVRRSEIRDLYAGIGGASVLQDQGVGIKNYGVVPLLANNSSTNSSARGVGFLPFPVPSAATSTATLGGALGVTYLGSLPVLVDGGDTNWIITRYFKVVLAGVMRYVRLYLGDSQGYLLERSEYENGIRDMLLHEEAATASTPVMRAVGDEYMGRGQS